MTTITINRKIAAKTPNKHDLSIKLTTKEIKALINLVNISAYLDDNRDSPTLSLQSKLNKLFII